jgi:hypothetical protein
MGLNVSNVASISSIGAPGIGQQNQPLIEGRFRTEPGLKVR